MENNELLESSLSRIWGKIEKYDCATLTAQRGNLTTNENKARNYELKTALKARHFDVTEVVGYYDEDVTDEQGKPTGKKRAVKEVSYFVANQEESKDFFKFISALGKKFDQDSVLCIRKGGDSFLTHKDGSKTNLGTFHAGTNQVKGVMADAYTRIKGRPYVFKECTYIDNRSLGMNLGVDPCQRYRGKTITEIVELVGKTRMFFDE